MTEGTARTGAAGFGTGPGEDSADSAGRGVGRTPPQWASGAGPTIRPRDGEVSPELMARARRMVEEDLSQLRLEAVQNAAAARAEADTTAATTRRLAESEADAVRRGARSEAEAIRAAVAAEAEKSRRQAELEVSTTLLDARRQAERDAAEITETARALKQDLDRRESRLAEREERVDVTVRRVEQRTAELTETEQALVEREAELADREAEHERELERIAGLTAGRRPRRAVQGGRGAGTRRDAAILVRDIEAEAQSEGEQRARKIVVDAIQRVASEQTAESVVSVLHLPSGRDEGPDHRPRGPQHPRVRVGHRRQPDHRRHPRGRAAVLLRPGAPRDRPAHPGEAGPRRPDPPAPHRGGLRAQPRHEVERALRARRPRTRWSRSASPTCTRSWSPLLGRLRYRTQLRAERAQAPGRDRAHRRHHGRRAAAWTPP